MFYLKPEYELSLIGNYSSPKIMACNFEVPIIGEESECFIGNLLHLPCESRIRIQSNRQLSLS